MGDKNMKKNDKLIVIIGVIVLVIASIGIYYWTEETISETATRENIFASSGTISNMPKAIKVSNSSHFYALIATPLAIHYDKEGNQEKCPLYIEDYDNPSIAVKRLQNEQLGKYDTTKLDYESPKEFSLAIAKDYWKSSDAVLLIKNDQEGYYLGVAATLIASYLSIPVIVTDEVDQEVKDVLNDLDVEISLTCGDLEGYGKTFELDNIDEILDITIDIIREKFKQDVDYITLTNPRDAYPPKVLNSTTKYFDGTIQSANSLPSNFLGVFKPTRHVFEIPIEFKYARVALEIINDEPGEDVEKFGDVMAIGGSFTGYLHSGGSPGILDSSGNLKNDRFYYEEIFYDMGGEEFDVTINGNFLKKRTESYTATVTMEELDSTVYPLVKQLSSIAPYLTAYHKGIVFAKPEFAFANSEDVKLNGKNLPGTATPRKNPALMPLINKHVYENIHEPLNKLLAKITDINISRSVESLKEYCSNTNSFYITLVGDATMLPQYFYRNPHSDPFNEENFDKTYGTNTPSDFIYGNIDPKFYSLRPSPEDYVENDKFSDSGYPEMENIVGRITGGFDVQDASALIARTVFYEDVLDSQPEEWKDNALVQSGAGLEFQALPIINAIYAVMGSRDPMKCPTGQQHFLSIRTAHHFEEGEFNVEVLERGQAQREGFSKEALNEIKRDSGLLNKLFFPKIHIQFIQGLENINSLFDLKWWSKAFDDQSGIHGEESQENSNLIHSNAHGIFFDYSHGDVMLYAAGGPPLIYQLLSRVLPIPFPRSGLGNHGAYDVRSVSMMEMGPSVMFVEACGTSKIDSLHPYNTLSAAYLHAGVNAFISPSTYSAIGGYLLPRPTRVGFGLLGYISTALKTKRGEYIPVEFCGWMFEKTYRAMIEDDIDIGTALRDARNGYLADQIDVTYLWTPPLNSEDSVYFQPTYMKSTATGSGNVPVEKYAAIYQLNLLGDPAFNPYQPCNEGS